MAASDLVFVVRALARGEQARAKARTTNYELLLEEPRHLTENILQAFERPQIPAARARWADIERLGGFGIVQLLEVPQGQYLAVERIHAIERLLQADLHQASRELENMGEVMAASGRDPDSNGGGVRGWQLFAGLPP